MWPRSEITDKPIKYLVYSHHHYDHIAGGKPFKEAGARRGRAPAGQGAAGSAENILKSSFPTRWSTASAPSCSAAPAVELVYTGRNHSELCRW